MKRILAAAFLASVTCNGMDKLLGFGKKKQDSKSPVSTEEKRERRKSITGFSLSFLSSSPEEIKSPKEKTLKKSESKSILIIPQKKTQQSLNDSPRESSKPKSVPNDFTPNPLLLQKSNSNDKVKHQRNRSKSCNELNLDDILNFTKNPSLAESPIEQQRQIKKRPTSTRLKQNKKEEDDDPLNTMRLMKKKEEYEINIKTKEEQKKKIEEEQQKQETKLEEIALLLRIKEKAKKKKELEFAEKSRPKTQQNVKKNETSDDENSSRDGNLHNDYE